MADLFWGVSDALDLYNEYLHVQKSKGIDPFKIIKKEKQQEAETQAKVEEEAAANNEVNEAAKVEEKVAEAEEDKTEKEVLLNQNDEEEKSEKAKEQEILSNEAANSSNQNQTPIDNDNIEEISTTTTMPDDDQLQNSNNIENHEIGAGDGPNPVSAINEENRQTAGEDLLINSGMNFNPSLEQSPEEETEKETEDTVDESEKKPPIINILIFGGGDPRHIIKTMAKRYTHLKDEGNACSAPILKFFMIDGCVEIIARNMVLLGIALERPELISLRNKVHLFMDVYGNTLLRPICHQYLVSKSATLIKMVSDKSTLEQIAPFLNLDNLKYRERDGLQDTLEFWSPKPGYDFNIKKYWVERLRRLLAVRYDCRDGVFDWDLNMSLKSRGAEQICSQEYKYWRETGIAFTFPEYEQSKPNKTFATGLVRNGSRYLHRGYIGDIQTGPFCTFGLRSAEERLHRSAHGENDFRATEVTERNLLEYFYELQNGSPYEHNAEMSNKYGGVRFQMGERLVYDENDLKGICAYDQPWISVEGFEVHFLSMSEAKPLAKASGQWENFFDVAFVGYKYFELLEDTFPMILRKNGLLILETKLRSTEIKTQIADFEADLLDFAREANLEQAINYNALNTQNSILKFIKN